MTDTVESAQLLLCDVGNTNIKLGLANREKLLRSYSLPGGQMETEDSLGLKISGILRDAGVNADSIQACVVSSVVPGLDPILKGALKRYVSPSVFFAPDDLPIPLENAYPRPRETGADRLVGAYAARLLFPEPPSLLVLDFGTAVTFDRVSGNAYLGGLIFPGPSIAVQSLCQRTARLPAITLEFDSRDPQPCVDTATSIRDGVMFGYQYLVEGLCERLAERLPQPLRIVATGSFAHSLEKLSAVFDSVQPALVLDGLRNLYYIQISPAFSAER